MNNKEIEYKLNKMIECKCKIKGIECQGNNKELSVNGITKESNVNGITSTLKVNEITKEKTRHTLSEKLMSLREAHALFARRNLMVHDTPALIFRQLRYIARRIPIQWSSESVTIQQVRAHLIALLPHVAQRMKWAHTNKECNLREWLNANIPFLK